MSKQALPTELTNMIDSAVRYQIQHPDSVNFISIYEEGKGWTFMDAKTGELYCKDSFYEVFGYYPELPHPTELDSAGNIVRMQPPGNLPPDKNPRP